MTSRALKRSPLLEYIFEIRWSDTGEAGKAVGSSVANLFDEYEINLGVLFHNIKEKFPFHVKMARIPREAFEQGIGLGAVLDRFQALNSSSDAPHYPLIQYGPGVGTFNISGPVYHESTEKWKSLRSDILSYINTLSELHSDFSRRVDAISFRTIDFFEGKRENTGKFFADNLNINVSSGASAIAQLDDSIQVPSYNCVWILGENSPLPGAEARVVVANAVANGLIGTILDITITVNQNKKPLAAIETILNNQHSLAVDIFFTILKEEYANSLR